MNVISFITLLQEHPIAGLLVVLGLFAFLFAIKTVLFRVFSKQAEE